MQRILSVLIGLLLSVGSVLGQARTAPCNCPKTIYSDTKVKAASHLVNGKTIVLCGYKDTETKPVSFVEFVLFVCGQQKIIGFWDAQTQCRLEVNKDTLLVNQITSLPVGKNFAYEATVWKIDKLYFSGNNVLQKQEVNPGFPVYCANRIASVSSAFESANGGLDEAKMTLADELFMATISGSNQARKYLIKFKTKFGMLDGHFVEEYDGLISMLKLWDQKGSLQKQ